jgi:hypothetical protein
LLTLIVCASISTFASSNEPIKKEPIKKEEVKVDVKKLFVAVHLNLTMTSSCGVTWTGTYDCYSNCTLGGTIENVAAIQSAINAACTNGATSISMTFPQG